MSTLSLPWRPMHRSAAAPWIAKTGPREAAATPAWSPDGWIALLADSVRHRVAAHPIAMGTAEPQHGPVPVLAQRSVRVSTPAAVLDGVLARPARPRALVILLDVSPRESDAPGNRMVATALAADGYATLLVSLLLGDESSDVCRTSTRGAELTVCTRRTLGVLQWVASHPSLSQLPLCLYAAGPGAACALAACAQHTSPVLAVVCRGGRPELVCGQLDRVRTPTLFVVGENDGALLAMSRSAAATIACDSQVAAVPGARNLLADEHAIEPVIRATLAWFGEVLGRAAVRVPGELRVPPAPAAPPLPGH